MLGIPHAPMAGLALGEMRSIFDLLREDLDSAARGVRDIKAQPVIPAALQPAHDKTCLVAISRILTLASSGDKSGYRRVNHRRFHFKFDLIGR
jgi:hypothetical protein